MAILQDYHLRVGRFLLVGAFCFGVQYLVMVLLANTGVPWTIADAVGFLLSAQLNFVLSSRFTWGDRRFALTPARWLSYNGTALMSLVVNTAAFATAHTFAPPIIAAAAGVAAGTAVTYLVCDRLVFRVKAVPEKAGALT